MATINAMFRLWIIFSAPLPKGSSPETNWSPGGGGGGGDGRTLLGVSLRGWHFIPDRQLFVVLKLGNGSQKMYTTIYEKAEKLFEKMCLKNHREVTF